ncbi:hypothetical protein SOASR031_36850 [Leminorella grimontii]|nr:hypothetical protein SOASR031_36850 [Leminorella grimontii]
MLKNSALTLNISINVETAWPINTELIMSFRTAIIRDLNQTILPIGESPLLIFHHKPHKSTK